MSTHNLCFEQKYEKYQTFFLKFSFFLVVKFSIYLNRHVFVMKRIISILQVACSETLTFVFPYLVIFLPNMTYLSVALVQMHVTGPKT